jgi:2-methylcitrate dehydratase
LIHGTVEARHFDDGCRTDPKVRALTRRVKVEVWEEANQRMPEAMLCRVTLVRRSGETHSAVVDYHRGHWRNPMSDTEVEAKFRSLAAPALPAAQTDRLLSRLWKLEEVTDAGEIVRLAVRGQAGASRRLP